MSPAMHDIDAMPVVVDPRDFDQDEDAFIHAQYLDFINEQEAMFASQQYDQVAIELEIDERLIARKMPVPQPAYTPRYAFGRRIA